MTLSNQQIRWHNGKIKPWQNGSGQPTPKETQVQILAYVTSESELEVSKIVWKKNCMVVLSLSPILFILPCLAIRKKCFNASPWTYSVLPTLEMAADTSCLSPPCTWNFCMWSKILCCKKSNCQSTKWLWNPNTASGAVFHHLWYYPGPHETLLTAILGRHPFWRLSSWWVLRSMQLCQKFKCHSDCVCTRSCLERHHGKHATR